MPSEKSARVSNRKSLRNRRIRASTRTQVKKANETIMSNQLEGSVEATVEAIKALDKAVTKGVIHRNNAARRKSRLMSNLNRIKGDQS